jgi:hypothetical protein
MMGYDRFGSGFNDMMNGGWGSVPWLLFAALIIAGIVLLVLWVVRASKGHSGGGGTTPPRTPGPE